MKLHVLVPAMNEETHLFKTLQALRCQQEVDADVWVGVNQPEAWWDAPDTRHVCEANRRTLDKLRHVQGMDLKILDRSSPGMGWPAGKGSVGRARRLLMDTVCEQADARDVLVSLDADTHVPPSYLAAVQQTLQHIPAASGLSAPYYHRRTGDLRVDRAMLRYEIYLRYYAINMWRIQSPYAFTALGSAIACPVDAYLAADRMPPRDAGEDFYFLQKLTKTGRLLHWLPSCVYPAARFSDRVPFGTGQAMTHALHDFSHRYPLYDSRLFDDIGSTLASFARLHRKTFPTPMTPFLQRQLRTDDPWAPLRRTHRVRKRFVRACHERVDGLRQFQFLRYEHVRSTGSDEDHLFHCLRAHYSHDTSLFCTAAPAVHHALRLVDRAPGGWRLAGASLDNLDALRELLRHIEDTYRRRDFDKARAYPYPDTHTSRYRVSNEEESP